MGLPISRFADHLELKVPPALVVAIVAVGMWGLAKVFPHLAVNLPMAWRLGLAVGLGFAGIGLILVGLAAFRRHGTTVDPRDPGAAGRVVRTGPYRFTRNPMYVGFTLGLLGWSVGSGNPLTLPGPGIFVAYLTRFQIRPEERALEAKFGEAYEAYRREVPRWL